MACAPGGDCVGEATASAPPSHCAEMAKTRSETSVRATASPDVICCLQPAAFVDPSPAVATSDKTTRMAPEPMAAGALAISPIFEAFDRRGRPPGPDREASPPASGRDLRTLHQSFLN